MGLLGKELKLKIIKNHPSVKDSKWIGKQSGVCKFFFIIQIQQKPPEMHSIQLMRQIYRFFSHDR